MENGFSRSSCSDYDGNSDFLDVRIEDCPRRIISHLRHLLNDRSRGRRRSLSGMINHRRNLSCRRRRNRLDRMLFISLLSLLLLIPLLLISLLLVRNVVDDNDLLPSSRIGSSISSLGGLDSPLISVCRAERRRNNIRRNLRPDNRLPGSDFGSLSESEFTLVLNDGSYDRILGCFRLCRNGIRGVVQFIDVGNDGRRGCVSFRRRRRAACVETDDGSRSFGASFESDVIILD
jgi:hypothetical protein